MDKSGISEELGTGGLTGFNDKIRLRGGVLEGSPNYESLITILHESFHLAFHDIQDDGGYPGETNFKHRSEAVKFKNASHYEEIVRRHLGCNPAGGVFTPIEQTTEETLSSGALRVANDLIRKAWIMAIHAHEIFIHQKKYNNIPEKALLKISDTIGLTFHRQEEARKVTQMDILLAEGTAKILNKALGFNRALILSGIELPEYASKEDIAKSLVNLTMVHCGQLNTGHTDLQTVLMMADAPFDLSKWQ